MPNLKLWWRSIDRLTLGIVFTLLSLSIMLITTTSSVVADRISASPNYFIIKQFYYIAVGITIIIALSFFSHISVRRISIILFFLFLLLLMAVPFIGFAMKGAKRWIYIAGVSIQPSELIKPFFIITTAWLINIKDNKLYSITTTFLLYLMVAFCLLMQPDFGMLLIISGILTTQLFVAGIPLILVLISTAVACVSLIIAYFTIPYVSQRIDSFFLEKASYQISKALLAFQSGGMWGKGPGEGVIKKSLPDSHTDFIFAVASEELGGIGGVLIISLFAFLIIYNLYMLKSIDDKFKLLAIVGLLSQIAIQSIINIAVNLYLIPTKGTTLPLISYGGSSLISMCAAVGILLSLSRTDFSISNYKLNVNKHIIL